MCRCRKRVRQSPVYLVDVACAKRQSEDGYEVAWWETTHTDDGCLRFRYAMLVAGIGGMYTTPLVTGSIFRVLLNARRVQQFACIAIHRERAPRPAQHAECDDSYVRKFNQTLT